MKSSETNQNNKISDHSNLKEEKYKYRKNSTLYYKTKFKAPPSVLFEAVTPSYGLGVGIYFDVIQQLFGIFLIMFIISIGCLYLNINGDGIYDKFKLELDVLTLANQPIFLTTKSISESTKQDYQLRMNIYQICDCVYSIIFFIYLMYARRSTYKKIERLKQQSDSIKYFTVQVTGFPENVINAFEIKNHFERIKDYKFNVAECILQRNYQDTLRYQQEKLRVQQRLEIELNRSDLLQENTEEEIQIRDEKLKKLREQIQELDNKINKQINQTLSHEELSSVKAFVTFTTKMQKKYAITLYQNFGGVQDASLRFKQIYPLTVSKAEDPSCIIVNTQYIINWENQDVSLPDFYAQKLMTITIGIVISIFVIINFLIFSKFYSNTWRIDQLTCLQNSNMSQTDPRYEQCVCMLGSNFKADSTISCRDSYSVSIPNTIFGLIMSIFLFIFRVIMDVQNSKERHHTKIQQFKGIFQSVLFWMILNSIIFLFFFHFTFDNVNILEYLSYAIPPFKDSQKMMTILFPNDINRNWIINIGYKITLTAFFNSILPQIIMLITFLSIEWFKEQKQEKKRVDFTIDKNPLLNLRKDHPEINKNYLFSLPDKYGQLAFTCILGFTFSGPIPILLFITSLSLFIQIIFDRYMLMRYNSFDIIEQQRLEVDYAKFAIYFLKLMPWCILVHLIFSIYNLASPSIFPNIQAFNIILTDNDISIDFVQRIAKQIILSALFVLILLVLVFTDIFKCNLCLKKKQQNIQVVDEEQVSKRNTYIDCLNKIYKQGKLITYDICENEDYVDIINQINQEQEKNSIKKIVEIDLSQIQVHTNQQVEILKQQAKQNSQNSSNGNHEKQSKKFPNRINNIIRMESQEINLQNPDSSLNESKLKIDQSVLDNSLINQNNMTSSHTEEEPIFMKRQLDKGQRLQLGSSKLSFKDIDKQITPQNQILEEDEGELTSNHKQKSNKSQPQQKQQKLEEEQPEQQKEQNKKKKKKKKKKVVDNEIQDIIKDYQ